MQSSEYYNDHDDSDLQAHIRFCIKGKSNVNICVSRKYKKSNKQFYHEFFH